jgi:threonine synthase
MDHVLVRVLSDVAFPQGPAAGNPFVLYRQCLHSYHRGLGDAEFVAMVEEVAPDFRVTPFGRSDALSDYLGFAPSGGVWVKDETGNIAGSHKARHLMGILLHIEVAERLGLVHERAPLAIASCGNAALAAAVLAEAVGRALTVFVPVDADPGVLEQLDRLGASVVRCERSATETGDPTLVRLEDAIAAGALPFTCQGRANGLAIEGGSTLAYEMMSSGVRLDHLVVQVGGGALASACVQGMGPLPRFSTVQTEGAHPLERAYHRVASHGGGLDAALRHAATHRSEYMWPWEAIPTSVATGILDDETYDWLAVVRGMLLTGGSPLVVNESRLIEANEVARAAGYGADPTGTAGLAGLLDLRASGKVQPTERAAVLFTGASR